MDRNCDCDHEEVVLVIHPTGEAHYRCLACREPATDKFPVEKPGDWLR